MRHPHHYEAGKGLTCSRILAGCWNREIIILIIVATDVGFM
jgi:hypothetical protein